MGFRPSSTRLGGASEESGADLSVLRSPYGRFASGAAPRRRDTVEPEPPMTRAMEDTDPCSPEPDELSPAGVSFESRRFGDRAR
jgi:hypothetical protein